jgi:hypothetical protein
LFQYYLPEFGDPVESTCDSSEELPPLLDRRGGLRGSNGVAINLALRASSSPKTPAVGEGEFLPL